MLALGIKSVESLSSGVSWQIKKRWCPVSDFPWFCQCFDTRLHKLKHISQNLRNYIRHLRFIKNSKRLFLWPFVCRRVLGQTRFTLKAKGNSIIMLKLLTAIWTSPKSIELMSKYNVFSSFTIIIAEWIPVHNASRQWTFWWTEQTAADINSFILIWSISIVGAFLQATSRVPRWWIGERPPDMAASCDIYK